MIALATFLPFCSINFFPRIFPYPLNEKKIKSYEFFQHVKNGTNLFQFEIVFDIDKKLKFITEK